jgi:hypothetical protein
MTRVDHSPPPSETPFDVRKRSRKSFRCEKSLTDTRRSFDTLRCVKHRNSFIRTEGPRVAPHCSETHLMMTMKRSPFRS